MTSNQVIKRSLWRTRYYIVLGFQGIGSCMKLWEPPCPICSVGTCSILCLTVFVCLFDCLLVCILLEYRTENLYTQQIHANYLSLQRHVREITSSAYLLGHVVLSLSPPTPNTVSGVSDSSIRQKDTRRAYRAYRSSFTAIVAFFCPHQFMTSRILSL